MRIAVDARPLSMPTTGISRYTQELLARLIPCQRHQWFLYSDRPFAVPALSAEGAHARANLHLHHGQHPLPGKSTPFAQWMFPRWARRDGIEVFWSPRHHLPLLLPANIRQVVTIHDLVWREHPETMAMLNKLLERQLMPRSVARADRILTVSQATARAVQDAFHVSDGVITTTPLAAFCGREADALAQDSPMGGRPYILFVGTMEPRKNLTRALRAFAAIIRQGVTSHRFCLAGGSGWGRQDIASLARDLGIEDYVQVLGRVTDERLQSCYAHADMLLMPSLYEGFGLPLLEAMRHGVPVITSNVASMPEVAGEGGLLVDPHSEQAIAAALLLLIRDRRLHRHKSEQARLQASQFSWQRCADQTLAVIESLG